MLRNLMVIFLFILVAIYLKKFLKLNSNKKVLKDKNFKKISKKNLNNWMNLTKKERYNLSKQESITYFDKRKVLLAEIRKEYKKISKGNSEKNIEEK